jgi:hypothetical protein
VRAKTAAGWNRGIESVRFMNKKGPLHSERPTSAVCVNRMPAPVNCPFNTLLLPPSDRLASLRTAFFPNIQNVIPKLRTAIQEKSCRKVEKLPIKER